uniref:Phage / plasmid primase P4 n=1 Tax=uncultured marine virus TaxID=186617 RepID=A0A0F7L576_9VIRU|nr:phage / plasmid primase P4 [uncultured marine virus]
MLRGYVGQVVRGRRPLRLVDLAALVYGARRQDVATVTLDVVVTHRDAVAVGCMPSGPGGEPRDPATYAPAVGLDVRVCRVVVVAVFAAPRLHGDPRVG